MIVHTHWTPNLGGPRAQLELAEELRALGDEVEKFSYEDAFPDAAAAPPRWARGHLGNLRRYLRANRSFAARARAYVRANAARFDVIDANQTDLPFPKQELGFDGLLVARSVGLMAAYRRFEAWAAGRWPEPPSAKAVARRLLTLPGDRRRLRDAARSFRFADLVNVSNGDDLAELGREHDGKVVMFPFGLSAARRRAFLDARRSVAERLAARTVAFVGAWNPRKGSRDWPAIAEGVLRRLPGVRFRLLGTGHDRDFVLRDFPPELRPSLEVVPAYESEELPGLLAGASAGAFPGYLEGFGFGVLEMLAAGLPTVAYDAPGPREVLSHQALPTRVPAGDVEGFCDLLARLLALPPERYREHSADSDRIAGLFSWPEIARRTRAAYLERLEEVRRR